MPAIRTGPQLGHKQSRATEDDPGGVNRGHGDGDGHPEAHQAVAGVVLPPWKGLRRCAKPSP